MKNHVFLCIIACFCLVSINGCGDDTSASSKNGTIKGSIRLYSFLGDTLVDKSGIHIRLEGNTTYTTLTAADGSFQFNDVEAGIYTLRYAADDSTYESIEKDNFQFVGNGTYNLGIVSVSAKKIKSRMQIVVLQFNDNEELLTRPDPKGIHVEVSSAAGTTSFDNMDTIVINNAADGAYSIAVSKNGFLGDERYLTMSGGNSTGCFCQLLQYTTKECLLEIDSIIKPFMWVYNEQTKQSEKFLLPGATINVRASVTPYKSGIWQQACIIGSLRPNEPINDSYSGSGNYPPFIIKSNNAIYDSTLRRNTYQTNIIHFSISVDKDTTYYLNAYAFPGMRSESSKDVYPNLIQAAGKPSNTLEISIR